MKIKLNFIVVCDILSVFDVEINNNNIKEKEELFMFLIFICFSSSMPSFDYYVGESILPFFCFLGISFALVLYTYSSGIFV